MNDQTAATTELQRALENIRQERDTFDSQKKQAELWFWLRFSGGCVSIALVAVIMIASIHILLNFSAFPEKIVNAVIVALFVDILGLAGTVWKIVLSPNFITKLEPVTKRNHDSKNS